VPVVSVGNLTFGGTGKTPTVVSLVRDLVRRGRRPAVLSRGYGRRGDDQVVVVGPTPRHSVREIGDEPFELARRLPGVPIVVDADRSRGGEAALELGVDLLVLDDGFQHLRLARDLDVVLIDAGDPWGGGRLPPRGRLREPVTALRRADAVVLTKLPEAWAAPAEALGEAVRAVAPDLPVLAARLQLRRLRELDGEWAAATALRGRRIFAFAGIGRPSGLVESLAHAGAEVVATRWFADHHVYDAADLAEVIEAASQADAVPLTTFKDAVKLPASAPVLVVEGDMEPVSGSWDELWRLLPGEVS
jgi:tetraacyldisaccharide 4'-kinase